MATKLNNSDEKLMFELHDKILLHCSGKSPYEVACFVGALACGTLHHVADISHLDIKTFLLNFALRLRQTIEEVIED